MPAHATDGVERNRVRPAPDANAQADDVADVQKLHLGRSLVVNRSRVEHVKEDVALRWLRWNDFNSPCARFRAFSQLVLAGWVVLPFNFKLVPLTSDFHDFSGLRKQAFHDQLPTFVRDDDGVALNRGFVDAVQKPPLRVIRPR